MGERVDVVVIGAGIVGLATAHELLERLPGVSVAVVDKEPVVAAHQSSHNSGVIHSGVYYDPASHKTAMVAAGRRALLEFAADREIPFSICGKVIVAAAHEELPRLEALAARADANGIGYERLTAAALREHEPHVRGVGALRVPSAGIIDFGLVSRELAARLVARGASVRTSWPVVHVEERNGDVHVSGGAGTLSARFLVGCAGLHSDRLARLAGVDVGGVRIMPFRGEYFDVTPARRDIVRNPVYPVPDPAFPFLGVHLTTTVDGGVHAGPNAVPALRREGYRWRDVSGRDLIEMVSDGATWQLGRRYWRTGAAEIYRSARRTAFVRALQRLTPDIRREDLIPAPAGVRAQAIGRGGRLLDDFVIARGTRSVHVLNAPSPAATAAFAIGAHIADAVAAQLPRN